MVAYSDKLKKCGRENNGTEEISRMPAGEVCDSDREEVRKSVETVNTVRSTCGANYTLAIKFECYYDIKFYLYGSPSEAVTMQIR